MANGKIPDWNLDPPEDDPLDEMDEPHKADLIDFVPPDDDSEVEDRDCDYWNRLE